MITLLSTWGVFNTLHTCLIFIIIIIIICNSTIFAYNNQITLLSYIPKKNKNIILISTMHPNSNDIDSTTGEANKPEIISFYNVTKGGVDTIDKINCKKAL